MSFLTPLAFQIIRKLCCLEMSKMYTFLLLLVLLYTCIYKVLHIYLYKYGSIMCLLGELYNAGKYKEDKL